MPADGRDSDGSSDAKWAANANDLEAYSDTDHAKWSSDTESCDQCKNTEMIPKVSAGGIFACSAGGGGVGGGVVVWGVPA